MVNRQSQLTEYLVIEDEEGKEQKFEVLSLFHVEETGKRYIVLSLIHENRDNHLFIYRYSEDKENMILEEIDNETEWTVVEEKVHLILKSK
ncbi:DUF1292 domain-containing protein [Thermoflavimicrobium dichotomicum]|uniref:Uncharacterized protein n=1 Tax=Thermoflavimicrobium dichotomicum TaxID=46223 RepID=A0A1I3K7G4_9BACL|nr:DUF1292 domain-containing protein [Thermoflavimicrobium dichotomicum]SFI68218.1 Protein of unknown function [Thermoflavimicrobium dichotomicum]